MAGDPVLLDLSNWYNGDGISAADPYDGASLGYISGGVNTAFLADELPESHCVVRYGEAVFRFPSKEPRALNTLEPEGQVIPVPEGNYDRIYILGCALGGNYREQFILGTSEGRVPVTFGLSSMFATEPEFGECLAARTTIVAHPKGAVAAWQISLWAQTAVFGRRLHVYSLELPVNPNMRFFALTLA